MGRKYKSPGNDYSEMRTISAIMLSLLCAFSLHSQSVKDVMQDKNGAYIYAQARDSDPKVALEAAHGELVKKINEWCVANNVAKTENVADLQSYIQCINGEVFGQHRVFLYIKTAVLVSRPNKTEQHTVKQPRAGRVESEPAHNENSPKTIDKKIITSHPDVKLPEGRIGSIIESLLRCTTEQEILTCLAREKNSRGISSYGKGESKYVHYSYLVCLDGGKTKVFSPELNDSLRTEYATGTRIETPSDLSACYWFLKK